MDSAAVVTVGTVAAMNSRLLHRATLIDPVVHCSSPTRERPDSPEKPSSSNDGFQSTAIAPGSRNLRASLRAPQKTGSIRVRLTAIGIR